MKFSMNRILTVAILCLNLACSQAVNEAESDADVQLYADAATEYHEVRVEAYQETLGLAPVVSYQTEEEVIEEYDEDNSGDLNAEEEKAAVDNIRTRREEIKEQIKAEIVAEADVDADGTLTQDEIKAVISARKQAFRDALKVKNEEMRAVNKELIAAVREACGSNGKAKKEADSETDRELEVDVDAELSACRDARDESKDQRFAQMEEKRELIKNMIAEIQAVIQSLQPDEGDEEPEESEKEAEESEELEDEKGPEKEEGDDQGSADASNGNMNGRNK